MDGDFRLDIGEIQRTIERAEVISIYFPRLRRTLLADTRFQGEDEPLVKLVPMVDSVEERFRSIRRLRPSFPRPESITVIPWPKNVDSLVRLNIWTKFVSRFVGSGHVNAVRSCSQVLEELRRLEREEMMEVISGHNYHTIWQRKA